LVYKKRRGEACAALLVTPNPKARKHLVLKFSTARARNKLIARQKTQNSV